MTKNGLHPFFCYYGGKWRAANSYPKPIYPNVIEPFAGAAGYSLRHYHLDITLYDADPIVYGLWKYLIGVSKSDILHLPVNVKHVDDLTVCQEAKWLIGFWLNKATTRPSLSPTSWATSGLRPNSFWGTVIRNRIANQVDRIRHWKVVNKSYEEADGIGTWFIDPPYSGKCGRYYKCRITDYEKLAGWCISREGQIIVCERSGATWLPFETFRTIKSTPGSRGKSYSNEVVWLNNTI